MSIALDSERTTTEVFQAFMNAPEDYDFSKTIVPMKLAQIGDEQLVSRSQAKRLIARFDRFKTVTLDFTGVETIGQAFADELFRVYALAHLKAETCPCTDGAALDHPTAYQLADVGWADELERCRASGVHHCLRRCNEVDPISWAYEFAACQAIHEYVVD